MITNVKAISLNVKSVITETLITGLACDYSARHNRGECDRLAVQLLNILEGTVSFCAWCGDELEQLHDRSVGYHTHCLADYNSHSRPDPTASDIPY